MMKTRKTFDYENVCLCLYLLQIMDFCSCASLVLAIISRLQIPGAPNEPVKGTYKYLMVFEACL